jgi:hypothetical protein
MSAPKSLLKLALVGLDEKSANLFRVFVNSAYKDRAEVTGEPEAEVVILDMDNARAAELYPSLRERHPDRQIIVLSLHDDKRQPEALFVKKPTKAQDMQAALDEAKKRLEWRRAHPQAARAARPEPRPEVKVVQARDNPAPALREVGTLLDEQGFLSYFGYRKDIDLNDIKQQREATYDPLMHMQGFLHSAIRQALLQGQPMRIRNGWAPIYIFPKERKIWVDADEAQLRAACSLHLRDILSGSIDASTQGAPGSKTLEPLAIEEAKETVGTKTERLTPFDAFLWKTAIWTSKGRVPRGIAFREHVTLRHWPNLTRFLVTPHSLHIAALLRSQPHTPCEAARVLGISQQYVFAFLSAAHALGLVEVTQSAIPAPAPAAPQPAERNSFLRKVLGRLRLA